MSTGTFDPWQQVFTMSMLINGDSHAKGESAARLQESLAIPAKLSDPRYQALIGSSWTNPWGPYVYQRSGSGVADNAVFVAQNKASNMFVVAIAATNFNSVYDMLTEDLSVRPIQVWPYGQTMPSGATFPSGVAIAPGTSIGVNILQGMPGGGQTGPSLAAFLQSVQSTSATLVFTGHSLGGALAPALACALITQGSLDPGKWGNVYVYPTAGPTPGNGQFVQLFKALFPQGAPGAQPWQVWNSLLWNNLDIVPHAWNETTLSQIADLYEPSISPGLGSRALIVGAMAKAFGQGYRQLPSYGALAGTVVPPGSIANPLANPVQDPFLAEAGYQHIGAYFSLLGVQGLQLLTSAAAPPVPAGTV